MTWATSPATAGPPASAVAGQGGGYLRWDVTTQVAAAHNGFLIRDASERGGFEQQFHSKEKAPDNPPLLAITFGPCISAGTPRAGAAAPPAVSAPDEASQARVS